MTVIVWDGEVLASDRQATDNNIKRSTKKIHRLTQGRYAGWLAGCSGTAFLQSALLAWIQTEDMNPAAYPTYNLEDASASMILVKPGFPVMLFDSAPYPILFEETQYSIGSGAHLAYGALAMGADAAMAVQIASDFCATCGEGVDILRYEDIKKGKKK